MRRIADLVENAALHMNQADDVGDQRRVVLRVDRGLQVSDVAADAGEILLEIDQQTVGRVLVVIERVVVQRVADQRRQRLAVLQFLADRQRRFAVEVAAKSRLVETRLMPLDACESRAWIERGLASRRRPN